MTPTFSTRSINLFRRRANVRVRRLITYVRGRKLREDLISILPGERPEGDTIRGPGMVALRAVSRNDDKDAVDDQGKINGREDITLLTRG